MEWWQHAWVQQQASSYLLKKHSTQPKYSLQMVPQRASNERGNNSNSEQLKGKQQTKAELLTSFQQPVVVHVMKF